MVWATWWIWALLAVGLAILEVLAPSYMALGFAIGAGIVALGLLAGLLEPILALGSGYAVGVLLVLFAALSAGAWAGLRAIFGSPGGSVQTFDDDVND